MTDSLAFFDMNPIHIGIVLLIALILFGPQKLPEVGKQLGNALRDLRKAGTDMMSHFNTDHEPDYKPYDYNYPTEQEHSVARTTYGIEAPPDLTDYTIVGQPVKESHATESAYHPDYSYYNYDAGSPQASTNGAESGSGAVTGSAEKLASVQNDAGAHAGAEKETTHDA